MVVPKKYLGQHFLIDPLVLKAIAVEAKNQPKVDMILEIGPGEGVLTDVLLKLKTNIIAVELDHRCVSLLEKKFTHHIQSGRLKILHTDILQQNFAEIFCEKKYGIIANIPYQITAPLLQKITHTDNINCQYALLMMQREVAKKITTHPPDSILGLSVHIRSEAVYLFDIAPESFYPPPKVHSSMVQIISRKMPLIPPDREKDFFRLVKSGYLQRRKKLRNALKSIAENNIDLLLGDIDGNRRAETLSVQEWQYLMENWKKIG